MLSRGAAAPVGGQAKSINATASRWYSAGRGRNISMRMMIACVMKNRLSINDGAKHKSGIKRCGACLQIKPLSEFHRKPHGKLGVNGRCKACRANYGILRYAKMRKQIINGIQEWRRLNPEKYRAQYRRWYKKNSRLLTDSFVKRNLRLAGRAVTPEALQRTRLRISLRRSQFLMQMLMCGSVLKRE
jgi:hypothetical protein